MKNERILIHDFDSNLICDYFGRLERQGPGSIESTIRALSFIDNFSNELKIADLACGTGGQTITLAQNTKGTITGLDISPDYIEKFNTNAKKLCLQNRVKGIVGSMDNLPFQNEEFDVVWSEGAIANIGFEKGTVLNLEQMIDYAEGGVVSKQVIKTDSGNLTLFSFDEGQGLTEHTSPYNAVVQVLDGQAEISINRQPHILKAGQTIIMPANVPHALHAIKRFKMLLSMVKG